jgi:hypothetical protein
LKISGDLFWKLLFECNLSLADAASLWRVRIPLQRATGARKDG